MVPHTLCRIKMKNRCVKAHKSVTVAMWCILLFYSIIVSYLEILILHEKDFVQGNYCFCHSRLLELLQCTTVTQDLSLLFEHIPFDLKLYCQISSQLEFNIPDLPTEVNVCFQ